jgi:hypothetical protein
MKAAGKVFLGLLVTGMLIGVISCVSCIACAREANRLSRESVEHKHKSEAEQTIDDLHELQKSWQKMWGQGEDK